MKTHRVLVIPGDGIGQEIVPEACKVITASGDLEGFSLEFEHADMGGVAFDKATEGMSQEEKKAIDSWADEDKQRLTLPQETLDAMDRARDAQGAIIFGSVGRNDLPKRVAELALLAMRKRYGLNNNRPFIIDPILAHNSTLFRNPVYVPGFTIIRTEESLFTGDHGEDGNSTWTRKPFTRSKLEQTVKSAFEQAKSEGKKILCVSKYNVLLSEKVLSDVFEQYAKQYAGQVQMNEFSQNGQLIIDNAGMQFAAQPQRYANTVVIADAMFGDFLQAIMDSVTTKGVDPKVLAEIKERGINRTFIRELCGGLYFGERKQTPEAVYDTMEYDQATISRLAKMARNVSEKSGSATIDSLEIEDVPSFDFWARVLDKDAKQHGYRLRHMDIRQGVERLLTNPGSLGTVIADNMMGDLYTDLAAAVVGKSLGLMPSSEVNADGFGNYQQIAGSAPDIAGKGVANPIAEIRSAAMMLEDFGYHAAAQRIYGAVSKALSIARTPDIHEEGFKKVGTQEMGDLIVELMRSN